MLKQPTTEQSKAINSTAQQIAISASAGSGKTTTMINRIAHIIQMGNSRLDQLLVLTFTDASAQDMRKKLKKHLGGQFPAVELQAAAIGTFHSFCSDLVHAWFSVAEVSPSFVVMDEIESNQLKNSVFEKVVIDNYQKAQAAVDLFAATRTLDGLRDVVFKISDFLATRSDPEQWIKDTAFLCYNPDINQNSAVQALIDYYHQLATRYRQAFIDLQHTSPQMDFVLHVIDQILGAKTYADFVNLGDIPFPKVKEEPGFVLYKKFTKLRTSLHDEVCKNIAKQFRFPAAQLVKDIQSDRKIVELLLFLVRQFDAAYQAKKAEAKKLDFADLEKYTLKVLNHPEALASIRAKYNYIFVDEGQDTNPVQFKIIDILRGNDKLFYIVGDVKQSIYGFRDCEPQLFEAMTTDRLIELLHFNHNFRSTDAILWFVNQVMGNLMPDYNVNHKFVIQKPVNPAALQSDVKIEVAEDLAAQMELVYRQIVQAKKRFKGNEIAILCETGTHFEDLQKYLTARGIASVIDRSTDATKEPEIVLLNYFLFAAMNPTNEMAKYLTLRYLFNFSNDDLARVRLGQTDAALNQRLQAFEQVLTEYRGYARAQSTYEVLTMAATKFGMLEIPVVDTFLTAVRGIKDFDTVARYLYLLEHDLIKIELNIGAEITDAVKIMTIHHSKGLEFPMVILFDMGSLWSRHHDDTRVALDRNLGICVMSVDTDLYVRKSPVLRQGINLQQKNRLLTEKQRLLYVALTRAQKYLYIVGSWKKPDFMIRPNCMLDLINPVGYTICEDVEPSPIVTVNQTTTQVMPVVPAKPGHSDILVKQSVTALATAAEPFQDYVAPLKADTPGGKEYGTAFHQQVQYGDLPAAVAELVAGYTLYKEMPFLYLQGPTIVQGIMDLLAVKGQAAIIVDYKTTRLPVEQLITKYQAQLHLYAQALKGYQVKMYIYSTVHDCLINVK